MLQNNTCSATDERLSFTESNELQPQHVLTKPFVFSSITKPETSVPSCLHVDEYSDNFDSTTYRYNDHFSLNAYNTNSLHNDTWLCSTFSSSKPKPYNNVVHTNDLIIKTHVYQYEVMWLVGGVATAGG